MIEKEKGQTMDLLSQWKKVDGYSHETRDCTVRGISVACRVSYATAHAELKARGRQDRRGIFFPKLVWENPVFCGKRLVEVFNWRNHDHKMIRLTTAYHKYLAGGGVFLLCTSNHLLAVIDGTIYDSQKTSPKLLIRYVWRVEDANEMKGE